MCDYTLSELEIFFYDDISENDTNYSTYKDLNHLSLTELWRHANMFGYKEQRIIFNDCSYNDAFYCNYLNTYRTQVLNVDPYFNWQLYIQSYSLAINSEYYALFDFMDRRNLEPCASVSSSNTLSISSTKAHYTIIGEQSSYQKEQFMFHYGSGQTSTNLFGMVVPFKSKLLRGYFMYHYDEEDVTSDLSYNTNDTYIKLKLYIDGSNTNYYIEEMLDSSKHMVVGMFKSEDSSYNGCIIQNTTIEVEQNSILSWYCEELNSNIGDDYTERPYNPSRNRFIVVLESL
ncbi:hypothetical protein 162300120 [Organic Lake phycodnavirus 2]|nr:hypothetical protein 162300120 [Organic Lake phycodnavirus 2]